MGLTESSLKTLTKPFSFLSHCKVSCDSPCCKSMFGEDNHCNCYIDTHDYNESGSDDDNVNNRVNDSPRTLTPR